MSLGNLPPNTEVLIKITYVSELNIESGGLHFVLPGSVASGIRERALEDVVQASTESIAVGSGEPDEVNIQVRDKQM